MPPFRLAILDSNILTCLGLQDLLKKLMPMPTLEVEIFASMDAIMEQGIEQFGHVFVSSRIFFENAGLFRENPRRAIVMVSGEMSIAGMHTLNVSQSEADLVKDIMALRSRGHGPQPTEKANDGLLTAREVEVAALLCKGLINKEVADRMNVAPTTIITHRKNIMEKLHARSLADVMIYCVMHGIVEVD